MSRLYFAIVAGFLYTFGVGVLTAPHGLGACVFSLLLLVFLVREVRRAGCPLSPAAQLAVALASFIAVTFVFTSNVLFLNLGALCVGLVLSLLLLAQSTGKFFPASAHEYFLSMCALAAACLKTKVSWPSPKYFVRLGSRDFWCGMALALLPLGVFHVLFAQVNLEYRQFMDWLWSLLDIELIKLLCYAIFQSFLLHSLLSARISQPYLRSVLERSKSWSFALLPILALFFTFSLFQGKYLGLNLQILDFKQLSLYTQHGFWELLAAAGVGHMIWLVVRSRGENLSGRFTVSGLLLVFTLELLAISVFTFHKVVALQWIFGLKDTRLAATLAAAIITLNFLACLMILIGKLAKERLFSLQALLLLAAVSIMAAPGLDNLLTRAHPISYAVAGRWYKDYSYLLSNSLDNQESWGELILEAMEIEPPAPEDYYWGDYNPLCRIESRYSYSSEPAGNPRSFVREFHQSLIDRMKLPAGGLKGLFNYHYREKAAHAWLRVNQGLLEDFYRFVQENCRG
jgi:hypothetical protein